MSDLDEYSDNLYDPSTTNEEGETPTLEDVITSAIDSRLLELHTTIPCEVVKVINNSYVDVQISLMRQYTSGDQVKIPVVQNVPISHPRGADYWIKLPIAVGDLGMLQFSERSLDAWMVSGGTVNPADSRMHHLTDGIFIPGLYPMDNVVAGDPGDLVVSNGQSQMVVMKSGKFKIKNQSNELIDLLDQTLKQISMIADTLNQDTTNTIFGPQKLNMFAKYATIKSAVDDLDSKLETLKG